MRKVRTKGKKARREKGKVAIVGPLFEVTGKPLVLYAKGSKHDYYQVTLPRELLKLYETPALEAQLEEAKPSKAQSKMTTQFSAKQPTVNLYSSARCMNYLLLSFGQWPALVKEEETGSEGGNNQERVSLEEIKNLMGGGFPTPASRAYLREAVYAKVEQGHERIVIEAEKPAELEAAWEVTNDILAEARGLAHVNRDSTARTITILIRDDPKEAKLHSGAQIRAEHMFDLKGLTENMFEEVLLLLSKSISVLKGFGGNEQSISVALESLGSLKGAHAYIDFLWAYNCRQLVRAGRYGLFCGTGFYTPVTPVALGSFYKLLEHAVDQVMAILQVVGSHSAMGPDQRCRGFIGKLSQQLEENVEILKEIKNPLLHSIEDSLNDEDKAQIAKTLMRYQQTVRPQLGITEETYLRSATPILEAPTELQLPSILTMLKEVDIDKAVWLAQVMYPLQKICKFPANVAMLARILFLQTTRKPLLNVSQ